MMEYLAHINALLGLSLFCFGISQSISQTHGHFKCDNFEISEWNYLESVPFFSDETVVYAQCCRLCAAMDRCASFNYDVETHLCSLLPEASGEAEFSSSQSSISGRIIKHSKKASKNKCRTRPCRQDQVCATTTSGNGYICLQGSACSDAPPNEHMMSEIGLVTLTSGQANYTCDTGYQREAGSGHSICTDYNGWTSPSLVCKGIDCGNPPAQNHQHLTFVNSTLYPANVEYTCDVGYNRTEGNGSSSCQVNGIWSVSTLKCQAVGCGNPVALGHVDMGEVTDTVFMSQVTFTCSAGYIPDSGDATIECMENGTWSLLTLTCKRKDCNQPPSKRDMVVNVNSTLYEGKAVYTCADGYEAKNGDGTAICQDDESWTTPTLVCEIVDCGRPPEIKSMEVLVVSVKETTYQSTVSYKCAQGYTPKNTERTSSCMANGTWSLPSLTCTVVDCGPPPSLPSHEVSFENTTYRSTAMYECGLGYYIPGNGTSVCQADGDWSPICQNIPDLRTTKALEVASGSVLECRTVLSNKVPKYYDGDIYDVVTAECAEDEIITGCSALIIDQIYQIKGSWIWDNLKCNTRSIKGAQSVARCCKIPGLQCEYLRSDYATSLSCYKNFQLLDCACWRYEGTCYTTMTNGTCDKGSDNKMRRYAVCCTHDRLACYVKEVSGMDISGATELTTTCESGETMTACSGFNTGDEIQSALIEDRGGVDTCVIDPGSGSMSTLKGYVSCCKYK